jgi:hypothetical protein
VLLHQPKQRPVHREARDMGGRAPERIGRGSEDVAARAERLGSADVRPHKHWSGPDGVRLD